MPSNNPTTPRLLPERLFKALTEPKTLKAIPPTYAPPSPPPTGKPLTNRQKLMLAATLLVTILIVVLLGLLLQRRL